MRWFLLIIFLCAGCQTTTEPTDHHITDEDVISLIHNLSPDLGTAELDQLLIAKDFVFVPLEAEDEIRFAACFMLAQQPRVLVCGWAEADWFSTEQALTSTHFEGWLFLYSTTSGQRLISRYYEGQSLLRRSTQYQEGETTDILSDQRLFLQLAAHCNLPPQHLTSRLFTLQTKSERARLVAEELASWREQF